MKRIAKWIYAAITDFDNKKEEISAGVRELCARFPIY